MDLSQKVVTAWIGVAIAAGAAFFAYKYYDRQVALQDRNARLERTMKLLQAGPEDNAQRLAMFEMFPGRWTVPLGNPLPMDEARAYRDECARPWENETLCQRWDVARRHLNDIEPLAFAYVYDLGDRKVIAGATCVSMAWSFRYFENLITAFGELYGPGQSWQVIPTAVKAMERKPKCAKLIDASLRSPP